MAAGVVGREVLAARRLAHVGDDLARDRRRDVAALEIERTVEEPAAVEAQREAPLGVAAEGVFHLVPVVVLRRGLDRRPRRDAHAAQVREAFLHLALLVPDLLGVVEVLEAAAAADRGVAAARLDSMRRGAEDPLGASLGVLALLPVDRRHDPVAGERVLDEHHQPVDPAQRAPAEGEVLDLELQNLPATDLGRAPRIAPRGVDRGDGKVHPRSLQQAAPHQNALQMERPPADSCMRESQPSNPYPDRRFVHAQPLEI